MEHIKVLCIENQPECLEVLKSLLETAGFEVVAATTGKQALSLLKDDAVQGVLLEYDLPDSTGSAVRSEMKRIRPDVPVLLFAGVGIQTPFLLKLFDAYLRAEQSPGWTLRDMDS